MEGLHYPRGCGCKGIRTCLICERKDVSPDIASSSERDHLQGLWRYCYLCGKIQPPHPDGIEHVGTEQQQTYEAVCQAYHATQGFILPGIEVKPDFITDEEEKEMVRLIDTSPWKASQSGRYKQDYGPKPNFKRRKVKLGGFTGLPAFSKLLVTRMTQLPSLQDFLPVEQCHLEYTPDRGSAIDLHFDDLWLWGNRLVTINLLSDTFLFLKYDTDGGVSRGSANARTDSIPSGDADDVEEHQEEWLVHEFLIPMPRKSLIVLSDVARYRWKHAIPREAITSRRIAMTLREFGKDFMPGGSAEVVGKEFLDIALTYEGSVVT